jgi:conjugative relaxase-like TrwC/TraI family protein
LTSSAPKSVSLLFALFEGETAAVVRRAHDAAVVQALGYLEREAGEVRRGKDGVDRLPGGGFVAAAFRHRTGRAGDPQLHTHVLVANVTRGADGRWSALDGRQLYLQAKTAGTLYQTALRHEVRQLGLRFVVRDNGTCEIAGVPPQVLRAFSRRRTEIEAHLTERGETSRRAPPRWPRWPPARARTMGDTVAFAVSRLKGQTPAPCQLVAASGFRAHVGRRSPGSGFRRM